MAAQISDYEFFDKVTVKFDGDLLQRFTYIAPRRWNIKPGDHVTVPVGGPTAKVLSVNQSGVYPGPYRMLKGVAGRRSDEIVVRVPKGSSVRIVEE